MSSQIDTEKNKNSEAWSETKARKRKQSMMDVDNEKDTRPHFPPVKKALLVCFFYYYLLICNYLLICYRI